MLSLILKPFIGTREDRVELPELGPDTEMSLSLIESGAVFVPIDGKTALIIKCGQAEIGSLAGSDRIALDFDLIERPEFPSLGAYLNIYDTEGRPARFEYFFSLDSEEESALLENLTVQDYLDIVFYTTRIEHVKRTVINNDQKKELAALLTKTNG